MRIGIIGCGLIGEKRANAAGNNPIVAVNDVVTSQAEKLAKKTGASIYPSWKDVIAADIDAVFVATSHASLAEISLAAVSAGKHVLVEKPAGRNAAELRPVVEAARLHARVVKVGFNHRFHPALLKAKALIDDGVAGKLMYIRGRYGHGGRIGMEKEWRCQPLLSGGGEMIDQMPHLIDLSRWFLGDLKLEYGIAPTLFWDIPVDDNCFVALRAKEGQISWLHATWTEWKNMFSFEITGRDAKLVIDGLGGSYGPERLTIYKMLPQMGPPETTIFEYPPGDESWKREFEDFADAIAKKRRPLGDIEDALAVMEIVEQVYGGGKK